MRTKYEIHEDMSAAMATSRSTDHSRALSGAEWLQQLASELVEVIKAEQTQPLADAFDEQDSPGDGWRWLNKGEKIQYADEVRNSKGEWYQVGISIGNEARPKTYRRRIEKL